MVLNSRRIPSCCAGRSDTTKSYIKVKWSRYRPGVAQRVGRGIALLFHDRGTRRGWVVSSTPRPHFTPAKDPVPILQEAGWAPGRVWTGGKSRPHRDSIPDRPPRSSVAIPTELPGLQPDGIYTYTHMCVSMYVCTYIYIYIYTRMCCGAVARCASYKPLLHNTFLHNMTCCHNTTFANTNWIVNTII